MLIKRLAINDKLDFDTAKLLITEYRKALGAAGARKEGPNRTPKPTAKGE